MMGLTVVGDDSMSQSPEGSITDFHQKNWLSTPRRTLSVSQSPEGATTEFHSVAARMNIITQQVPQSPEGSTTDFHKALCRSR